MKRNKSMKLSLPILISTMAITTPTTLTSCSSSGVVLANFESYMSSDLMTQLHSEYPIKFVNYSTNEDILAKFANSYDIAVPSTYAVLELIKQGLCGQLDWEYLGQEFQLTADPERLEGTSLTLQSITNAKPVSVDYKPLDPTNGDTANAQWLFSDTIDDVINSVDEYAHENNYYPLDQSILQYALPYFLQDWMFAYHGDYMDSLPSSNMQVSDDNQWYSAYEDGRPVTWNDVTNTIASNNPNLDDRFKPGKTSRNLTMVDDSRTIYDMSHLIYDAQQPGYDPYANDNINPNSEQTTEDAMKEIYGSLTDKFNPNTFNLNTDSQQVLYSFAKPKGNPDDAEFGMSNGIIAYNGDILYAAMGSGIDEWEDTWYCDPDGSDEYPLKDGNFHIVKMKNTPIALDMMVINKKVNNSSKKHEVYSLIDKIVLEGSNLPAATEEGSEEPWIGETNKDDEFVYGPTLNFDFVSYTPTLWNLSKFVSRDMEDPDEYNSYFDMIYPNPDPSKPNNKAELLAEINSVNFAKGDGGLLELPLSDLTKSRMSKVYLQYREKI